MWAAFPDARLRVEDVITPVTGLPLATGSPGTSGDLRVPMTGVGTEVEGIAWLRFEDGQAVEVWQASGTLDTLTRLAARASQAPRRPSASAEAAALRWEERHQS